MWVKYIYLVVCVCVCVCVELYVYINVLFNFLCVSLVFRISNMLI